MDGGKHSKLLRHGNNYNHKSFYRSYPKIEKSFLKAFHLILRGQCYKNNVNLPRQFTTVMLTLLFLGLKYRGNLLSFQGKFNVIKITMVI